MKKLDKRSIQDIIALTPMQEGILSHYLKEPGSEQFFEQLRLNVSGTLHTPHFQEAWNAVIKNNEMLRAIFRWEALEKPVQVILKEHPLRVRYFDLSGPGPPGRDKDLETIRAGDRQEGFDLGEVPFRVTLCKTGESLYEMIISNHHILYDGWSSGIILKEFFEAYNALCKETPLPAPPAKALFKTFVRRSRQQDRAAAEQKKFWEQYLAGFGGKGEPAVKKKKKTEPAGTGTYRTQLPEEIKEKLEGFVKKHNITAASLFYGAWGVLLQRYNGVDDVLFDTTVSGRAVKIEGIENSIGLFINTLPLRVQTRPGETGAAFLARTHDMLQQWKKFEDSSLLNINEQLDECRGKTLFDSVVVIENYPIDSVLKQENSPLSVHSFSIIERTHYDLTVIITAFEDIKISITYNKALFDETSMGELCGYFTGIVNHFLSAPDQAVDRAVGIPEAERKRLFNVLSDMAVARDSAAYLAPRNETEKKLAAIWSKVLRVDESEIGINSDFFDFGGHSLKAALLATAIHEELNVKIPLAEVFKRPTIRELAEFITGAEEDKYTAFEAAEKKEYYPLSSAQKRFYMLQQADLQSKAYNAPYVMLLEGEPDKARLQASFEKVIQRHESLRTAFIYKDGEPVQRIQENVEFEIEYIGMEEAQTIKRFVRPFDLSRAPLLRVGLQKTGAAKYLLLFDIHHIISDGSSINILIAEFMDTYAGKELPGQWYQYKDFAQWQYNGLRTGKFREQEEFLLERFSGELPVLDLPLDFPRPPVQGFEGDRINFYFPGQLRERMDELTGKTGTTLNMLLTAVLGILLSKYTGLEDIIIGSPTAGRRHRDLSNIFGLFVEMAAVRIFPAAAKTFDAYLGEVRDITLKSYENQDYPFGELKNKVLLEDDLSRNPLFDVMLIVQNQGRLKLEIEDLKITPLEIENKTSKMDINLEVYEEEKGTRVELEYCTRLFLRGTMERFFRHFERVLGEVTADPTILLSSIDMMSQEEKRQILEDFNDTDEDFPVDKCVHELVAEQVERTPYGTAVVFAGKYLTYLELDRMAGFLAGILRRKGVKPDEIIGIMPERSLESVAGLLGILKAGGAYLPMDTDYPQERIDFMLKDSGAKVLITDLPEGRHFGFNCQLSIVNCQLLMNPASNARSNPTHLTHLTHPTHLSYVMYTSGSTGRPKGVGAAHGNVVNTLHWFARTFNIQTGTPLLQLTDYTFDPSVEDIFGSFSRGGVLHIADREMVLSRERFRGYVDRNRIEIVNFVPTMLIKLLCPGEKLESLRVVISGGERLEEVVKDAIVERGYHLYNNYGPTEITVDALSCLCEGKGSRVTIGRPVSNMKSYILDSGDRPVPVGIVGELCLSGAGVTRGYLNNQELTAEKFIAPAVLNKSFCPTFFKKLAPGGPPEASLFYRTGDLARWFPGGSIEFLGRVDRQVKIRGYRVEPGEIENHLLRHPCIGEAAVTAIDGKEAGKFLCAYFVSRGEQTPVVELREYLSRMLPDYMVPAYFIELEQIPLMPNGKIDKKKLPLPAGYICFGVEYTEPESETEKKLAAIWREILGLGKIGTRDNFFAIGGNSIIMIQSIVRIREDMQREISLKTFFRNPTIEKLSAVVEGKEGRGLEEDARLIGPAPRDKPIPLSFPQERIWFLERLYRDYTSYYVPRAIRIKGELDPRLLERVFTEIIRRHEILRTRFREVEGKPVQEILAPFRFKIPVIDMSHLDEEEQLAGILEFIQGEGRRKFDLAEGPLIRAHLLLLGDKEQMLVLCQHHLVHDGWTQGVLLKEFIAVFRAFSEGNPSPLPELPIQYADFAVWQRNYFRGEVMERHIGYWKTKLAGLPPVLELPSDRPRPAVMSGRGGERVYYVPAPLSRALMEFSRSKGVTLYMAMLAIFKVLLYRYTGVGDLCVGTGVAGRHHKEMEGMLGMIINTIALRTGVSGDITFQECLERVKTTCLEAYEYEETPFEKVVEVLRPERSLGYTPLFQVLFSFMDVPEVDFRLPGLELSTLSAHNRTAKFNLNIISVPADEQDPQGRILMEWEYNTDIYDEAFIDRMSGHYMRLLEGVVNDAGRFISELPMLSDPEIEQLLYKFNDTASEYSADKTIHRLFEEQAARSGDRIAVQHRSYRTYRTYKKLNEESGQLAALLMEKGLQPGDIAAILGERSVEMVKGILAILKAGGAYLPIDAGYPEERIRYMLADSGTKVLLTDLPEKQHFNCQLSIVNCQLLMRLPNIPLHHSSFIDHHSGDLAYVMYTSGSTGWPKGVMVNHRNVVRLVKNTDYVSLTEETRILQTGAPVFDATTFEIWGSLLNGGQLVLVAKEIIIDAHLLGEALKAHRVNTLWLSAPLFNQLMQQDIGLFAPLRYLLVGGDVLSPANINRVKQEFPGLRIINGYGPTENTTFSTTHSIEKEFEYNIPIGRPIANSTAYIYDRDGQLVPVGVWGELVVGGDGVSQGYLNSPELTAERFNRSYRSYRSYKTGDLARWLPDGAIEFKGRLDQQVKIRGFRVELGEIEKQLLKHPSIKQALVIDRQDQGDKYLCAYIIPVPGSTPEPGELRTYLSAHLPGYMVPSFFIPIDSIPLNPNGKIDRKALPEPGAVETAKTYTAPGDAVEEQLVNIWSEVLNTSGIGIDDNFFDLGGHSLNATLLVARMHKAFNIKVPLVEFFVRGSIREVARFIKEAAEEKFTGIRPVEKRQYYPLSSAQKRLYILHHLDRDSIAYNIPFFLELEGVLDKERLEGVFQQLIRRHESLRTSFTAVNDEPVQEIHDGVEFKIGLTNTINDFTRAFDLSQAPLMRVGLTEEAAEKHILMVDMHHIITDGTSMGVLVKEFTALYSGETLSPLALHYKDYARWQRHQQESGALETQAAYWREQFRDEIPVLELPVDFTRPTVQRFEGRRLDFEITSEQADQLRSLAKQANVTLFTVLLAAYHLLLSKLSGRETIVIGTAAAGRRHADLEPVIGMFVNTLGLKNHMESQKSFDLFLQEINRRTLAAFENQDYPFEELVEEVAVTRDAGRNPLFDVMFVLQNIDFPGMEIPGLKIRPHRHETDISKFDLMLQAVEIDENIVFTFEYSTGLFKEATIRRFIEFFRKVVSTVTRRPAIDIFDIEIISEAEKQQILVEFNDTAAVYPKDRSIHCLFEEEAQRRPDKAAVVYEDEALTYRELNRKADELASRLQSQGVVPGMPVGIKAAASLEMIVGVTAILKAGGAYLPIETDYPEERVEYMLADSGAAILLTDLPEERDFNCQLSIVNCQLLMSSPGIAFHHPGDLAYIIYTSGSTGKPKGVMVEHGNVVRLVKNTDYITFKEDDRILQTGALAFDASTFEIWGSLLNGLTLYLADKYKILNAGALKKIIRENRITVMWLTAPLFNQLVQVEAEVFAGLEHLLVGGDVLSPPHINKVRQRFPGLRIINGYGPTENTTFSTTYLIEKEFEQHIPIGRPIANSTAYIVDKSGHLQPIGIVGELRVGGDGIARGYLNNPELTADRFNRSYRSYKTGDLARWLPDPAARGAYIIEFLGRMDHQVKIRGFRIEPGEIESRLLNHHAIKEAVVIDRKDGVEKYLCAYIVSSSDPAPGAVELKTYLSKHLPGYMIPSFFIPLEKIPLTPNGKVDRRALPEPETAGEERHTGPRDGVEKKLAEIWADVLGMDKRGADIGLNSDFFQLGGDSLKTTALAARIHKEFDVKIPIIEIFNTPFIRQLGQYIKTAAKEKFAAVEPTEGKEFYPLSSAQKRLYVLQRMELEDTVYNMPQAVLLEGTPVKEKIEGTFRELIRRHESLRTSFETINQDPVQRVHDHVEFAVEWHDIETPNDFVRPFDLSKAPLMRVGFIKSGEAKHVMIVDMHHIISDGTSMGILIKEFMEIYKGTELPPLRLRYRDFARWQNLNLEEQVLNRQEQYWLSRFEDSIPVLDLPIDYSRPAIKNFEGSRITFEIAEEENEKLQALVRERGVTLYMVVLSVLYILLAKLGGQEDIVIGTPTAGRRHADLEEIIGMFVNTLALRNSPKPALRIEGFLHRVKEQTLAAFENQDYQFENLVEKVVSNRDAGRNPLFDVMFSFHDMEAPELDIPGLTLTPYEFENKIAKFDLSLDGRRTGERLNFTIEYCTKLFKEQSIKRFARYFKHIVSFIPENPARKISEIEIITAAEKRQILNEFNNTRTSYPGNRTIHEIFQEQAGKAPDTIALIGGGVTLTYRRLNEKTDQLARLLREKGVTPNRIAAVMMKGSIGMAAGIWAIFKAGGAYLPIDPDYPQHRIRYMLTDSRAGILLSDGSEVGKLNGDIEVIDFNNIIDNKAAPRTRPLQPTPLTQAAPADPAYVIYTSGSTGRPKGVLVRHSSVVNRMYWMQAKCRFNKQDVILHKTTITFDISVSEMFSGIPGGASVVIAGRDAEKDMDRLVRIIENFNITVIEFVPSHLKLFLEYIDTRGILAKVSNLRLVLIGGEAVHSQVVKHFTKRLYKEYGTKLINGYGPTEATVDITWYDCTDRESNNENPDRIPIGVPIANTHIYILDEAHRLQPVGVVGELCTSGKCLARGYLNRPALTHEKFVPNPFEPGEKMYRTGDFARWLPDGNIEFLGRIDEQVKIRGFRIELGEIENHLLSHEAVKEAVVIAKGDENREKYLVAYVVLQPVSLPPPAGLFTVSVLREHLAARLPDYMNPSYFIPLEKMPLTSSGKIDRKALPEPDGSRPELAVSYLEPQTDLEIMMADIWKEVLNVDKIGINDSFFELGGNSLDIIKVNSMIKENLQVDMPMVNMFRYPTIRLLVGYLKNDKTIESFADRKQKIFKAVDRSRRREGIPKRRPPAKIERQLK